MLSRVSLLSPFPLYHLPMHSLGKFPFLLTWAIASPARPPYWHKRPILELEKTPNRNALIAAASTCPPHTDPWAVPSIAIAFNSLIALAHLR